MLTKIHIFVSPVSNSISANTLSGDLSNLFLPSYSYSNDTRTSYHMFITYNTVLLSRYIKEAWRRSRLTLIKRRAYQKLSTGVKSHPTLFIIIIMVSTTTTTITINNR